MASSEEDGAVDEKETNNKRRNRGAIATAWLTFYNIAMTAGYVGDYRGLITFGGAAPLDQSLRRPVAQHERNDALLFIVRRRTAEEPPDPPPVPPLTPREHK